MNEDKVTDQQPPRKPDWELLRAASLAATVLASAGATYAMHERYEDPNIDVPYFDSDMVVDDVSTTVERSGEPYVETIEIPTPGDPQAQTSVELHYPDGEYAREFEDDPNAEVVDQPAAEQIQQIVGGLREEGWDVRIEVTGHASAEDESTAPDGGTTTPSNRNIALADTRRDTFVDYLDDSGVLPANVEVIKLPGREGNLTVDQYSVLQGFVEQFGYDTVGQMIDEWNLDHGVPPSVESTLEAWLSPDRSVAVSIIAQREIEGQEGTVMEESICVIPVKRIETTVQHEESGTNTFTMPAFIILPVPIVRRRRALYDESRIESIEKYMSKYEADRMRDANEKHLYPRQRERQREAVRKEQRKEYKEAKRIAKAERKRAKSSPEPATGGVSAPNIAGSGSPRESLPWRKIIAGVAAVGVTIGGMAWLIGEAENSSPKNTGTPQVEIAEDPYCPPELREVIRQTGEVEHRTQTDSED